MRKLFLVIAFNLFAFQISAQQKERFIQFSPIEKDSVAIHYDASYKLIEDSCSVIMRRINIKPGKNMFKGHFTDVDKSNPNIVLARGFYSEEGKLNGNYEEYYTDKVLKGKGVFKDGLMVGNWTIFKENGNKWVEFSESNGVQKILNAWDEKGKQIVKDGNGTYVLKSDEIQWIGKLVNGLPDGTWRSSLIHKVGQGNLSQESFSKGKFITGTVSGISYQDQSKINFEPREHLISLRADEMKVSEQTCDGQIFISNFKNAYFKNGNNQLTDIIRDKINPALGKFDFVLSNMKSFRIYGIINEKGSLSNLRFIEHLNYTQTTELLNSLSTLPNFVPAVENGVNVKSTIIFEFTNIGAGRIGFKYRLQKFQDFKSFK